jgi:hypothetical protein
LLAVVILIWLPFIGAFLCWLLVICYLLRLLYFAVVVGFIRLLFWLLFWLLLFLLAVGCCAVGCCGFSCWLLLLAVIALLAVEKLLADLAVSCCIILVCWLLAGGCSLLLHH